jgi:hypothetical protein
MVRALVLATVFALSVFSTSVAERGVVSLSAEWKACTADADCAVISPRCNGCCDYDSIHTRHVAAFAEQAKRICADYKGPYCDCMTEGIPYGACKDGVCTLAFKPRH